VRALEQRSQRYHRRPASSSPPLVIDLVRTYQQLAQPWTADRLAAHYRHAYDRGQRAVEPGQGDLPNRAAIALVATAIPPAANLSVAIHVLHALPSSVEEQLARELVNTAEQSAAAALVRCHRALELDGKAHSYSAEEWQPVVYDVAAPLLASARLDEEPPGVVRLTQDAISWLSRAILELHEASPEVPSALTETIARLLAVSIFTAAAHESDAAS
jgi:hypothetical protein